MMRDYTADELLDLAGDEELSLTATERVTGVVVPRDYMAGEVMPTDAARRLAAQLLRAADTHDAIYEAGWSACESSMRTPSFGAAARGGRDAVDDAIDDAMGRPDGVRGWRYT